MIQNLITELVCIDCGANLMRDLAEDGALFDTARGNEGTTSSDTTGFDCLARFHNAWMPHRIEVVIRSTRTSPARADGPRCGSTPQSARKEPNDRGAAMSKSS
jgi:hypothetical protein